VIAQPALALNFRISELKITYLINFDKVYPAAGYTLLTLIR